ncbi:Geranylgeranyl transferase type-2 subunit alpha [Entamoeba marina]
MSSSPDAINWDFLLKNWTYTDLGILPFSYNELPDNIPSNEIDNPFVYINETHIGLFFPGIEVLYKWALKNLQNQPCLCTTLCLLINPDCTLAWTIRFRLDLQQQNELSFTQCITTYHRKGFLLYHYREMLFGDKTMTNSLCLNEFTMTTQVISRYPRGYHLYKHLLWLLQHSNIDYFDTLCRSWTEKLILNNPHDYTVLSLRHSLLLSLFQFTVVRGNYVYNGSTPSIVLNDIIVEYMWICTLIYCVPGCESLWLYHYMLCGMLQTLIPQSTTTFNFNEYFEDIFEEYKKIEVCNDII